MIGWVRARLDRARSGVRSSASAPIEADTHVPSDLTRIDDFLRQLDALVVERRRARDAISRGGESNAPVGFAVFVLELRRNDRTQALAGSEAARALTRTIIERLRVCLRPGDRYALYGVDEVLVLLPEVDSAGRAMLVASRLVQTLREAASPLVAARLRPAIGCAIYPAHGDAVEELIGAADAASRAARHVEEGYCIGERSERAADVGQLSKDLETALNANQLEVWLQPQLNLRTGRHDAAEALIRWPRPEGSTKISPISTVEMAEAHGMMPQLTMFVLNTVLRQSALFMRREIDLRIAINVSASMLTDENLPQTVRDALELWGVPPERLTLEVTENTLMRDVERSLAILHELKALGTRLSLDDFGTGYSSFAYLRRMPLDELKIDQLFIRTLSILPDGSSNPQREDDLRIVRSIIDIAHNFDLQAVAEGVEDEATLELLQSLGCDVIQGYFTGRPMTFPAFESWWLEQQR